MASLADSEIREFLEHGTRTAVVGFSAQDGRPLVAPVWFVLDDEDVVFTTGRDTAKGRSLARDSRLSLCVDMPEPPYGFVQVQGVVETSDDPVEMRSWATRLASRYMGEERAVEFGRRNAVPGELLVRLSPTKVVAELDMTG